MFIAGESYLNRRRLEVCRVAVPHVAAELDCSALPRESFFCTPNRQEPERRRSMGYVITTVDGSVALGFDDRRVWMRISDEVADQVERSFQSKAKRRGKSLGDRIAKSILAQTSGELDARLRTPIEYDIDEIDDVRWESGRLHFEYRRRHTRTFEGVQVGHEPALESFDETEAREFAARLREMKERRSRAGTIEAPSPRPSDRR
jgi:hypothetical protein